MADVWYPAQFLMRKSLDENSRKGGRDHSPVSVMAHSAIISPPSSSCASMERQIYDDRSKLYVYQEHRYFVSDQDDMTCNMFAQVKGSESLPETHSSSSKSFPAKALWFEQGQENKSEPSMRSRMSENIDLRLSETDPTVSQPVVAKFRPCSPKGHCFGKGAQDGTVAIGRRVFLKEHDQRKHLPSSSQFLSGNRGMLRETASCGPKPMSALDEFLNRDRQRFTTTSKPNVSTQAFVGKRNKDPIKHECSRATVSRTAKTHRRRVGTLPLCDSVSRIQEMTGRKTDRAEGINATVVSTKEKDKVGDSFRREGTSRACPFKWDDAERRLVNEASSSNPPIGCGQARGATGLSPGDNKCTIPNIFSASIPIAKPETDRSATIESTGTGSQLNAVAANDGDLRRATAQSCDFARSGKKQLIKRAKLSRLTKRRMKVVRSSGGNARVVLQRRRLGTETPKDQSERGHSEASEDTWACIAKCHDPDGMGRVDSMSEALSRFPKKYDVSDKSFAEKETRTMIFTQGIMKSLATEAQNYRKNQDKSYVESFVKTLIRDGEEKCSSGTSKSGLEFVVQSAKHLQALPTSVKDVASGSGSPTIRSVTGIENNSSARHNTPVRQRSPSRGNSKMSSAELEGCHLAKVELRDLLRGSRRFESFDASSGEEQTEDGCACLGVHDVTVSKAASSRAAASAREDTGRAKHSAKHKRKETPVDAWERLQRSKAEAELEKLDAKLEKLRCQERAKIMSKLKANSSRAREMRAAAEAQQATESLEELLRRERDHRGLHFTARSFLLCFAGIIS